MEPFLTNLLVSYMNDESAFIASRIFPAVPVVQDSGSFWKYTKKYWFLDGLQRRAPGDPFASVDFGIESDTYKTEQHAADTALADETRANSQLPVDLLTEKAEFFGNLSLLRKEIAWATDFWKTGVWGTDNTSATDWDDYSSGDPVGDIQVAKRTIQQNTGKRPNMLIVGAPVHDALVNHPDIIDRIKRTQMATESNVSNSLASVFGVQYYLVGEAVHSDTNEAADFSGSFIFDDDALLIYSNPNAGLRTATAGKTFVWAPGGGTGSMYSHYSNDRHATVIQHKEQWDQKLVSADLGYFWSDIV